MNVLLDTHIWLWWISGAARLGVNVRNGLDEVAADNRPCVSAISLWEVQMLASKGRIHTVMRFDRWLRKIASPEIIAILPLDVDVAIALHSLPKRFHGDPADRLIVATSRAYALPLATHDEAIRQSRVVKLWKP